MASSWEENFCDAGRCGRRRGASVCWRLRADPAEHGEGVGAEKRGGGSVTLPRTASPTGSSPGGGGVAGEGDVPSPPKGKGWRRNSEPLPLPWEDDFISNWYIINPAVQCPLLSPPLHGSVSGSNSYGDVVHFTCKQGYRLVGKSSLTCLSDAVQCPLLSPPLYGSVSGFSSYGDVVHFTCEQGYRLVGKSSLTCLSDGTWSGRSATCADMPRYLGCYKDSLFGRLFPSDRLVSDEMTTDTCIKHCQGHGHEYAATQYSHECWCRSCDDFLKLGERRPDSECDRPCPGRSTSDEFCGGTWRMSVYRTERSEATQKWREDCRCGAGYTTADGRTAECNPDGNYPCCSPGNWCGNTAKHCGCADCVDYRYSAMTPLRQILTAGIQLQHLGCWGDTANRAVPTLEGTDPVLDGPYPSRTDPVRKCQNAAAKRGYTVFAVQNGGWCAASADALQTYVKYGPSDACRPDGEGGPWANEVYRIVTQPPSWSASSEWDSGHSAHLADINSRETADAAGAWAAATNNKDQWLMRDLGDVSVITGVITKGRNYSPDWPGIHDQYVTSYVISYGNENGDEKFYTNAGGQVTVFPGNHDRDTGVINNFRDYSGPITARFIKIHPRTWHGHISMRAKIVTVRNLKSKEGEINVGLNKAASQSSLYRAEYPAERAVDGNTGTTLSRLHECTHTNLEYQPWWKVDLGDTYVINHVTVINRGDCCGERLKDLMIRVGHNEDISRNEQCGDTYTDIPEDGAIIDIQCTTPMSGRWVSVQLSGRRDYLSLCEVQVFSTSG
ncbi:hypothetical protein Bbelb_387900 [Branchiostoma belcheri]|nr:hypothetical protein Bbelb_387900 [Branchiostoma belcheri]